MKKRVERRKEGGVGKINTGKIMKQITSEREKETREGEGGRASE